MGGSTGAGEVTGAILAGGQARRFNGLNKAALEFEGERLIDRQLRALRVATTAQVVIANAPGEFADLAVPVVADLVAGTGPLGGLYTALSVARHARVLVLACDLPFVHGEFLRYLVARAPDADVVVPRTADGLHPLCAVYAVRLRPIVAAQLDARRLALHDLLDRVVPVILAPADIAAFDPVGRLLMNINSQTDYDAARRVPSAPGSAPPIDAR